jgi:hypothetical protein
MTIQLTQEEFNRINKWNNKKNALAQQINDLMAQHSEIVDIVETAWKAGARRWLLENPGDELIIIPDFLTAEGKMNVTLDPDSLTVEWQSD